MITKFRLSSRMSSAAAGLLLGVAMPHAAVAQSEACTPVTTQSLAIPALVISGSKCRRPATAFLSIAS